MKNRLKKFLSVALVAVMTLASVVITDIQPVHAASGAITEAKGGLRQHMLSGHQYQEQLVITYMLSLPAQQMQHMFSWMMNL